MIENLIMQFGALGIVGYVVYVQMTTTNKILYNLRSSIEKNISVMELCLIRFKK